MGQERSVPQAHSEPTLLAVRDVSKRYGRVRALDGVSLDFHRREIHAVVGENGAGKTTLERIIAGEQPRDAGEILLDGHPVEFGSPAEARRASIAVVHQDFPLVPAMTVAENMFLGDPELAVRFGPLKVLARRRMREAAAEALRPFGLAHRAGAEIRTLGVAERQLVEIARATAQDARMLILDEPTSSLSPSEVELFFDHVRRIRDTGAAVMLITHRVAEVVEIADRVSALQDGRLVHTGPIADLDAGKIVALIAGRKLEHKHRARRPTTGGPGPLLTAEIPRDERAPWQLTVGAGEIVGVAGLLGSGAQELVAAISGEAAAPGERVALAGTDLTGAPIAERIAHGLCLLPGDHDRALAVHLRVEDNVLLPNLARFRRGPVLTRVELRRVVERLIRELDVRPADRRAPMTALSGGNKQKVAIAKWLASNAKVIVMDDPFRGVDVGAKHEISGVIDAFVQRGGGVLLYSSDTRELAELADRILVMHAGAIVKEFQAAPFDEEAIMASATGAETTSESTPGRPA